MAPPNVPRALLVALAFRGLSLALPHTFFQPDEFYQAFEPAFALVFNHGYLTWEWRDLPVPAGVPDTWWTRVVVGGRLRGWIWPGLFALVYKLLQVLGLASDPMIVLAPRIVGVIIAAFTDYYTSLLAAKVLGSGYASGALFLSLTSLFNAHLLPRALSTSPETLLTTMALYYYPLPSLNYGGGATKETKAPKTQSALVGRGLPQAQPVKGTTCGAMDRTDESLLRAAPKDMCIAAALAAVALCIRPTMLVFWAYLQLETTISLWRACGWRSAASLTVHTLLGGSAVVALSTALDWTILGRLTIPTLSFFYQNIVLDIASFYGGTGLLYHVVQSLPLLLFPIWLWWGQGFLAALLPQRIQPATLGTLDITPSMRTLSRTVVATIAALSLSPHSEWRFLHPLLPQLLLFALPALQSHYSPTVRGYHSIIASIRQYCRLPASAFYLILLAPIAPYLYLNCFHGAAQVSVVNGLRSGDFGTVSSVAVLMPCHSTPWSSHLGSIPGWFLTCEPPLANQIRADHWTQQDLFYASPVRYLQHVFPYPPAKLGDVQALVTTPQEPMPSHIILFGEVLDRRDTDGNANTSVAQALAGRGYYECATLWNGFDFAQDEERRRGAVRVWARNGKDVHEPSPTPL